MMKAPWLKISHSKPNVSQNCFSATVVDIIDNNVCQEVILNIGGAVQCCATTSGDHRIQVSDELYCYIDPEQIVIITLY